jgi:hypothetical protein
VLVGLISPERAFAPIRLLLGDDVVGPALAVLIDGLVAIGDVVGGFVLLSGRLRGRYIVTAASGIGIVAALVTLVFPQAGVPRYGPSPVMWVVLHVVIASGAILIAAARTSKGPWQPAAYAAYAFIGLIALYASGVFFLFFRPPSQDPSSNAAGLGFFLAVPFFLTAGTALVIAGCVTLARWREPRLWAMLGMTFAFGWYLRGVWNYEWWPWLVYGSLTFVFAISSLLRTRFAGI